MCKACGNGAAILLTTLRKKCVHNHRLPNEIIVHMDNPQLINKLSIHKPRSYLQPFSMNTPLFEQKFYPVSTVPTITKTN